MFKSGVFTWGKECLDIGHNQQHRCNAGPMPALVKNTWWHLKTSICLIWTICAKQNGWTRGSHLRKKCLGIGHDLRHRSTAGFGKFKWWHLQSSIRTIGTITQCTMFSNQGFTMVRFCKICLDIGHYYWHWRNAGLMLVVLKMSWWHVFRLFGWFAQCTMFESFIHTGQTWQNMSRH